MNYPTHGVPSIVYDAVVQTGHPCCVNQLKWYMQLSACVATGAPRPADTSQWMCIWMDHVSPPCPHWSPCLYSTVTPCWKVSSISPPRG